MALLSVRAASHPCLQTFGRCQPSFHMCSLHNISSGKGAWIFRQTGPSASSCAPHPGGSLCPQWPLPSLLWGALGVLRAADENHRLNQLSEGLASIYPNGLTRWAPQDEAVSAGQRPTNCGWLTFQGVCGNWGAMRGDVWAQVGALSKVIWLLWHGVDSQGWCSWWTVCTAFSGSWKA